MGWKQVSKAGTTHLGSLPDYFVHTRELRDYCFVKRDGPAGMAGSDPGGRPWPPRAAATDDHQGRSLPYQPVGAMKLDRALPTGETPP